MNKSLMLMLVVLMFANSAVAQESQVKKVEEVQLSAEEIQRCKALSLKEHMETKRYHYHDGWVEHLDSH